MSLSLSGKEFPYINRADAARYLTISVRKLDQLVAAKEIVPGRIGRRVLFDRRDLDAYFEAQKGQAA
jgi:excisionase family DNA binding protein